MASSHSSSTTNGGEQEPGTTRNSVFFIVTAWHWIFGLVIISGLIALVLAFLMGTGVIGNPLQRPVKVVVEEIDIPDDGSLAAAEKANRRLQKRLADLQGQLKRRRNQCVAGPVRNEPDNTEEICRLCREYAERNKKMKGTMSISLLWQGRADLDLHLICPNGDHVKFGSRNMRKPACDARLNVDMNANNSSSSTKPIENITLGKNAPAGTYRIAVRYYARRRHPSNSVPFKLSVRGIPGFSGETEDIAKFPDHNKNRPLRYIKTFTLPPLGERQTGEETDFNLDCSVCSQR